MKQLTEDEFAIAPLEIQILYTYSVYGTPVSGKFLSDTMKKHPQYFQDELDHWKKWEAIPQEVHDQYQKERAELHEKFFGHIPSKGLVYWLENPEEYSEWNQMWNIATQKSKVSLMNLFKKHYEQYGIKKSDYIL